MNLLLSSTYLLMAGIFNVSEEISYIYIFEQTFISNGHQILFCSLWNKSQIKYNNEISDDIWWSLWLIENSFLYFESKSCWRYFCNVLIRYFCPFFHSCFSNTSSFWCGCKIDRLLYLGKNSIYYLGCNWYSDQWSKLK